jgi:hypothetical protein
MRRMQHPFMVNICKPQATPVKPQRRGAHRTKSFLLLFFKKEALLLPVAPFASVDA